jgi:hypothetical protein
MRSRRVVPIVLLALAASGFALAAPPGDVPSSVTPELPNTVDLPEPFAAPELGVLGAGGAIALLVGVLLLMRERGRRR